MSRLRELFKISIHVFVEIGGHGRPADPTGLADEVVADTLALQIQSQNFSSHLGDWMVQLGVVKSIIFFLGKPDLDHSPFPYPDAVVL